jgi:hypothetical protein
MAGSRHHKKSHGNSNKKTCSCCSWNGNNKSITKQKGCQKDYDKSSVFHNYEEYLNDEEEAEDAHCATWTTCFPNSQLYDKQLSDFISEKVFNQIPGDSSSPSSSPPSSSKVQSEDDDTSEAVSSDDSSDDNDWEIISIDSVIHQQDVNS